ncbi:Hypothetical predicted protein [Mytilus galloprovincialis]|uniref:Immunoglobulin domain-containing protein n=1 Tax=Mytilus galloprovincialis TaxID=29158 RepID=A0A8B6H3S7_MYTGA|nr:Hypothetical predicted protein [Mytilus galloprovincialis]
MLMSGNGEKLQEIQLVYHPRIMDVLDKNTVAVVLENNTVATVDTQQINIEYFTMDIEYTIDASLYKRPLKNKTNVEGNNTIFECETETESDDVGWLKDGVNMVDDTEKIKTEIVLGRIFKLTIKCTSLLDIGKYSVHVNGILSEAALDVKALFKEPLRNKTSLESEDTVFECKTEKEDSDVKWFKDGDCIIDRNDKITMKILPGYIYQLTVHHTSLQDRGKYTIQKNGIRCDATLDVTALFKRQLSNVTIMEGLDMQFECETEDKNNDVDWFKDDLLISSTSINIKMETLPGHIYRLVISPATLQDNGSYRIEKNGICSEAVLDVKEMPETIKQMSEDDSREFLKATKSGTQKRYHIRVLIVGENSVGKTCLLRRLLNEPIDDVQSTDGLDIERRKCQVDVETAVKHPYSSWSGHNEQFADCAFWDFAGQKQFYATHQTFLNANAVYLLAVDISKEFTKQTHKEMIENTFDGIGEYTDFWLDNIHCYNTDVHDPSNKYNENPELNPPVIIVGTGMDKIPLVEREERKQNYQDNLRKTLSVHAKRRHLRKAHFVSNTSPFDRGEEFCRLRKDIFNKARAFKNWGENLPSRWIILEKEIYGQISVGKYTISYDEAIQLATDCSFPELKVSNSELDAFLKYEHDIGNVIYFEDIKDFIVLDPKWLVDVFKCFVSNQYKNELIHMTEWSELENKGKLLNNLIIKLLEKVPYLSLNKHKQFILQVMEKFDIIVTPINFDTKDFYMPCMIKEVKIDDIIKKLGDEGCTKTSWFILEFEFLPPSYFNHILVSFVKRTKLLTKNDQLCIYRNIGLFPINDSGTKVLIICLSKNCIAMQVWQWNFELDCYSDIKNTLMELVRLMQLRYRINITYKKRFKCSESISNEHAGRVDCATVLEYNEYLCIEHKKIHSSKDIIKSWLTEEDIDEEYSK